MNLGVIDRELIGGGTVPRAGEYEDDICGELREGYKLELVGEAAVSAGGPVPSAVAGTEGEVLAGRVQRGLGLITVLCGSLALAMSDTGVSQRIPASFLSINISE